MGSHAGVIFIFGASLRSFWDYLGSIAEVPFVSFRAPMGDPSRLFWNALESIGAASGILCDYPLKYPWIYLWVY